jgi:hypothetical protein
MSTCEYSHLDGSYVLGALSPSERQEFERHLEGCAECSAAVRQLAGLPGLLARVDADVLTTPAREEPPPNTLLPALVREVRRSQRRRTYLMAGAAAAATVTVALGSLALAGDFSSDETPVADPRPGLSASATPGPSDPTPSDTGNPDASPAAGQKMVAVGQVPVRASVAFESVPWGTRLSLTCTYTADSDPYHGAQWASYALVVRTRDGRAEQVATWRALPGRTMMLDAATASRWGDIASVEVRAADGKPVLKLTT